MVARYACFDFDRRLRTLDTLGEMSYDAFTACFEFSDTFNMPSPLAPALKMIWKRENPERLSWIVFCDRCMETFDDTKIKLLEGDADEAASQLLCVMDVCKFLYHKITLSQLQFSDENLNPRSAADNCILHPESTAILEPLLSWPNLLKNLHGYLRGHSDIIGASWETHDVL